jgi:hypothetical protein
MFLTYCSIRKSSRYRELSSYKIASQFYRTRLRRSKKGNSYTIKIYEVDPLTCPKCQGRIRIIAFIEDQRIIKKFSSTWDYGNEKARLLLRLRSWHRRSKNG